MFKYNHGEKDTSDNNHPRRESRVQEMVNRSAALKMKMSYFKGSNSFISNEDFCLYQ